MGFDFSQIDFDIWMRSNIKIDKVEYYEYAMWYVHGVMVTIHDVLDLMKKLGKCIKYKNNIIKPPTSYFCA